MGKTKSKKSRRNRPRPGPTAWPTLKELEEDEEFVAESPGVTFENEALARNVEHITDLLQSPGSEDKECAAYSISNLAAQPGAVTSLLKTNILKVMGPLLVDPCFGVRHSISGALRNLSAFGGHDVCDAMIEQDILTPLVALLKQYDKDWTPAQKDENRVDSQKETFIQAVHLLWNLCESNSVAVSTFNKAKLLPVLTRCLCIKTYGTEIVTAIAQCLHTVSEDNEDVIVQLSSGPILEKLNELLISTENEAAYCLIRALASGILLNIYGGQLSRCPPNIASSITSIFESILNIAPSGALQLLGKALVDKQESDIDKYCSQCSDILAAKQIVLEVLTNVCCSDDADEWNEMDSSDTSEDAVTDDDMDMSDEWVAEPEVLSSVPREIQEAIFSRGMMGKILDHLVQPPEDLMQILKREAKTKDILKKFNTVRCRALLCIHNIVEGLSKPDKESSSQLYPVWKHLAQLAFKETDFSDTELLEAATSAMRAITQKLASSDDAGSLFQDISFSDLQLLYQVGEKCPEDAVRTNIVRIVGTIGCVLANPLMDGSSDLIKSIGTFLLDVSTKDGHLCVVAESLDCIFDVFGEDHLDPVMREISLLEKLRILIPVLKGKISQQKKTLGPHYAVVSTAKTNLSRFIQYKTKHGGK